MGASAADTGAFTMFVYCFDLRERIIEFFETLCGSRLTYNYVRPGGVSFDLPDGWLEDVSAFLETIDEKLAEMDQLFFGNVIARGRMKGIGVLSAEDAVAWGITGPAARASGVNWDLRKHDPYSVYPLFDFDVVVGDNGDSYDRGRTKIFECRRVGEDPAPGDREDPRRQSQDSAAPPDRARRPATPTTTSSRRAERWASTSSPTVPFGRTGCTCARRRSATSRSCPSWSPVTRCPTSSSCSVRSTPCSGRWTGSDLWSSAAPFVWGMVTGLGAGLVIAVAALIGVWWERKVSARVQLRLGPQQAGPVGLLQTLADTLKLVLKEDITPARADRSMFRLAPFLVFAPIATSMIVLPVVEGWAPLQIATGALFFLAVPGISAAGILLAGWSSRNTYATIGGIRGAAQVVSYELPRTLSVLALCILGGTLNVVRLQESWRWWWILATALGFVVYLIASIAELNRGPFDLPEAESELVAGFFADYSGIRWAVFMMAEYGGIVAAAAFGAIAFFGGGFGVKGLAGTLIMVAIICVLATVIIWVEVDVSAHAPRPAHVVRVEGPHAHGAAPARDRGGDRGMAVTDSAGTPRVVADSPAESVPLSVSVSDEYARGIRGFLQRWGSVIGGLRITGRKARVKAETIRYPFEKVELSPRWRGALRLSGVLGRDDVDVIHSAPPAYNALIDSLYRSEQLPPCVGNCPANVDARGQNYFLADNDPVSAYELVRERNIMPGVLGRICHHPCETACRRNYYDEPIAIRPLHRIAQEAYEEFRAERVKPLPLTQDKHVAIIGSGPSGLAAALDLMRLGYEVTCYEKDKVPGGALVSGVPAYRLPRDVLATEIDDLVRMGMHLMTKVEIGTDVPIDHLVGEFDAVLIAAGLQESRILPIPGTDAEGVVGALPFLRAGNFKGDAGVKGKRVMVIGGGNVAVDCARVALRVGASEVRQACLEGEDEMPCHPWEIEEALDEGVISSCGFGPHSVLVEDGHVVGMRMQTCLSVFDAQGRFSPQFADEFTDFPCDVVVFAIGQAPALKNMVGGSDLVLTERGLLPVDGSLMSTAVPSVFACGEVVTGPGSCIASIASGHEAAASIHRYLSGQSLGEDRVYRPVPVYERYAEATLAGIERDRLRPQMPMSKAEDRAKDFRTVELGFTRLEGLAEAARCLRCESEVCVGCTFCARTCPDYAIQVERVDDPGSRAVTRYDLDLTKCCFCGLCAEQCPTGALQHTGQYELSFYHRDIAVFDRDEMVRPAEGTRATGTDARSMPECPAPGGRP